MPENLTIDLPTCEHCGGQIDGVIPRRNAKRAGRRVRFCGMDCLRAVGKDPFSPTNQARFWARVDKNGPVPQHCPELGPCWVWTKKIHDRYAMFSIGRSKLVLAHRYGYRLQNGPLADDELACHRCDLRKCVRGSHLFKGSHADNMIDMAEKGRSARGERNPQARLTEDQIREIRRLGDEGATAFKLAEVYPVTETAIRFILLRRTWKHVE